MKFYGVIGFVYKEQIRPGIHTQVAEEHEAYGDVLSNVRRWETDNDINDDLIVSNQISVIASRFFCEHLGAMRYVRWNGTAWKIKSANLVRPRIILTLGGVYNEAKKPLEEAANKPT